MMPAFWMISDRSVGANDLGKVIGPVSYWVSDGGDLTDLANWTQVTPDAFRQSIVDAADTFPVITDPAEHEDQKHVTLFIHGYNSTWADAAARYQSLCEGIFSGADGMGICLFFTWPSKGAPQDYLPDRAEARASAPDLADILNEFYDWLVQKQVAAARIGPEAGCKAKTSIIAHSMGNFVLQKAMPLTWTRQNRPLLVSLVNQLLMVAADVDNDLFGDGEATTGTDGDAVANLTYRVTALYSGRDPVLGLSAGLKHFGKRRLGRSGLDGSTPLPDNVWEVDCTPFFEDVSTTQIHGAYFEVPETLELIRRVLQGVDRTVLVNQGVAPF